MTGSDPIRDARPLELIDVRLPSSRISVICVLNAGTDDFEQMEALLAEMEASLDDPKRFSEFDTQFHACR